MTGNIFNHAVRFLPATGGNVAIATTLLMPVLLGLSGITMDLVQMVESKARIQSVIDSAALAAATARAKYNLSDNETRIAAAKYMVSNAPPGIVSTNNTTVDVATTANAASKTHSVKITTNYQYQVMELTALITGKTYPISVTGSAESVQTTGVVRSGMMPATIMLVLDRSGSMSTPSNLMKGKYSQRTVYKVKGETRIAQPGDLFYFSKLEAMKLAVAKMLGELNHADPDHKLYRVGVQAFSGGVDPILPPTWGVHDAALYVNSLTASGGTAPGVALFNSHAVLASAEEDRAHLEMSGKRPAKTIVFMTDGLIKTEKEDMAAQAVCQQAKADGMEVYTVGFMVPQEAQRFLFGCATDSFHTFLTADAQQLDAVFKKISGDQIKSLQTRLTN